MSCMWKQTVLRLPVRILGINSPEKWEQFQQEHRYSLRWDPGHFAPALCGSGHGYFLDYILEDCPAQPWDGADQDARPLTLMEMKDYLPAFRKMFPDFTMKEMYYVHCCEYVWYNGVDAPYLY